jgi:chromosomal replication initiator protein
MRITEPKQLWKVALAQIEIKLDAPATFKMFFQDTTLTRIEGKTAFIGVSNPYTSEWLKSRYETLIRDTLSYVYGEPLSPIFELSQHEEAASKEDEQEKSPLLNMESGVMGGVLDAVSKSGLNPKNTLSTYIVGNANRIAHAASQAIVNNPGQVYNPLFIYGRTGVGKTHLAQGIGRAILEKNLKKRVLYVSSEGFLNDLVKGIKTGTTDKMRSKYRGIDCLIIDDMQLISKWVSTQTEFFNTFNELYNAGKQIILIADRKPEDIINIESRLRSRMQGGMVAEIAQPDYETRLAILQKKSDSSGYNLSLHIIEFIAKTVTDNVRELEGSLQKVALFNSMKPDGELSLEEVAHTIGKDSRSKREQVKVPQILKGVSKSFNVSIKDIKGPRRTKEVALARQVAMYILREEYSYKLEEIAKFLNREDHTTVMHGIEKVKQKAMIQEGFNSQISSLITAIQESAAVGEDENY